MYTTVDTLYHHQIFIPPLCGNEEFLREPQPGWKTIGVKVRVGDLPLLNRQLARFNYNTLGDLVKGLIAGKIAQVTEDQQIEIMKTNLQTSGQLSGLSGKPYDFYKQIDVSDFIKYLMGRYSEHTANMDTCAIAMPINSGPFR
ncbi:MAG: hypothetical protein WAK17_11540 [Candidatus Nitrosopolaris sp.]|jgi:hypothetical protein